jgi:ectoine hydroxylase-related dioxygenase (phytanoyl-CoA dioxygenase family)
MMHPHRWDYLASRTLLDTRVLAIVGRLLGETPLAAQSMFYWKPPGARGQALHQDNFYLRVAPHSCIAAWTAVDHCDAANGGLQVVPRTHELPIQCPGKADLSESFVQHFVPPPPGTAPVQLILEPGDTLFFNGNVIHGSGPNRSSGFRRAFICHYIPESARECSEFFFPLLDRDGKIVERACAAGGGPCGDEPRSSA